LDESEVRLINSLTSSRLNSLDIFHLFLERGTGLKPASLAWKARAQSIYQPRNSVTSSYGCSSAYVYENQSYDDPCGDDFYGANSSKFSILFHFTPNNSTYDLTKLVL
jgi:hypothetical protein